MHLGAPNPFRTAVCCDMIGKMILFGTLCVHPLPQFSVRHTDQILGAFGGHRHAVNLILGQIFNAAYLDFPERTSKVRAVQLFGAETYFSECRRYSYSPF
jgi:hypothetical protein